MTNAERENRIFADLMRHGRMYREGVVDRRTWESFIFGYPNRSSLDLHTEWLRIVVPILGSVVPPRSERE